METSCASHWAGLHLFGLISPLVFLLPVMLQVLTFDPSPVRTAVMDIIIVRPRSEEQRRLQLCAKPPRRPIAAQRASASSLPASGAKAAHCQALAEQCWPASFAAGGRSAHLAGARSTRSWLSSQANRSGGVPEQSRHAAPAGSCFLDERGHRGACLRQIALNADMTALALQHRPQRSGRSGGI
eukprot:COSAG06_NODE_2834_length_6204_cov_12.577396_1_plen_184_part_00